MQEFYDPSNDITHFAFGDVSSTNDEAFRLGEETGANRLFVTGKRQLAGRGRRGRPWVSEEGNLYASLFLRNPAPIENCAQLSFVAAVSLHEAICARIGDKQTSCALKWPNDVLFNKSKVCGLLLEARGDANDTKIVIGMGTNCTHFPKDTPYPATSFAHENIDLSPDDLFQALKDYFLLNLRMWDEGKNFEHIRKSWLEKATGLGDEIVVRLENEEIRGTFKDLDHDGQLILGLSRGRIQKISAGDVFFPAMLP
ncbi:MAG: biotin--[acetyl-CoA-carboxylase] ligase [Hyphomicrobiales bacterium]